MRLVKFAYELDCIKDGLLKNFAKDLLALAPDTFFTIPASSSGKYHPAQSNEFGGLVNHTKLVCRFCHIFARAYNADQHSLDQILVAAIAHDMYKPSYDHAVIMYKWLLENRKEFTIEDTVYFAIADMIRYHMGRWTLPPCKPIGDYTTSEWILHLADMAATDKGITYNFDKECTKL